MRETLSSIRALMAAGTGPTVLRLEADRLAELRSPSADLVQAPESSSKTAAMIIAEAASSILAQANYSQRNVSDLLTFMSDAPAPKSSFKA